MKRLPKFKTEEKALIACFIRARRFLMIKNRLGLENVLSLMVGQHK